MNYTFYAGNSYECAVFKTYEPADGVFVFSTFREAKKAYIANLKEQIQNWNEQLKNARSLKKSYL